MAIAPFITPSELGMRPGAYNYTKGGVSIDVEAFAIYFDEDGVYNEYNVEPNAILSWSISPNEFYIIDEETGFQKINLNDIFVYDVNGDSIEFGTAYPASRVSKITIKIFEKKQTNARWYKLETGLFDLTVSYLPRYLQGSNDVDNQVTKKIFCTAPYKLFTNEYLILKDKQQMVQGIILPGVTDHIIKGTIVSDINNKITFAGAYTPSTFYLTYNTLGKKDINITLEFNNTFLIKNLLLTTKEIFDVQNIYEDYKNTEKMRFVDSFISVNETPPYIAPNEFVVEDNINAVFRTMSDQLEAFLLEQKIINPQITKRLGWYNTPRKNWNYYVENTNGSFEFFEPAPNVTPIIDVFATDSEIFYIKDNAIYEITKLYDGNITFKIEGYNSSAPFLNVKNIILDSKKKLFVFDAGAARVGIFSRNFTRTTSLWVNQLYFGGIGGRNAKNKFLLPNSIFLDNDENLHVVDTGNSVVKKYSNDGTWLQTIKSKSFDNTLIHGATDSDYNYHILKPKTVAKVDKDGNSVLEYKLFNPDSIPLKIITEPRKDFLFVIYRTKVQKYHKSGKYIATIYGTENVGIENADYFLPCQDLYNFYWSWDALSCAQNLDLNPVSVLWRDTAIGAQYSKTWGNQTTRLGNTGSNTNLDYNIYSGAIDQTRNLYIVVGSYLQKMLCNTHFLYLGDELNTDYYWDINDILVQKEEIVQDWVYNRSFQRMWDNIELVRKCIIKKMNVISGSYQTKFFSKKDFDSLKIYEKDSIVFGQNEIVTTDVLNRNVEKLWNNIKVIKDMLNYRDLLTEVTTLTAKSKLPQTTTVSPSGNETDTPSIDTTIPQEAYFALGFVGDVSYPEFIIKLTDNEKISRARRMIVGQEEAFSITGNIIPSNIAYNNNYSYHLDPTTINFAVESSGLCNVDPVYIERNLPMWMETVKTWCPNNSYIKEEKTL